MSHESINSWVQNAKMEKLGVPKSPRVPQQPEHTQKSKGARIMDMAERFFPWLIKMTDGVQDNNGMNVQPAHVRALALNLAQHVVQEESEA